MDPRLVRESRVEQTQRVDRQRCRVDGVHSAAGGGGVTAASDEGHAFADETVVVAGTVVVVPADVVHDRHVHVVEDPLADQCRFAAERADFTFLHQFGAPLDLDALFGGSADKGDLSGNIVFHSGVDQRHRRADHGRDVAVVAAGVDRAGALVAFGVLGDDERIHFAQQRHGRTGASAVQVGAHAGDRQIFAERQSQRAQFVVGIAGGLEFLEARLRIFPHIIAHGDDFRSAAFDGVDDRLLDFFQCSHCTFSALLLVVSTGGFSCSLPALRAMPSSQKHPIRELPP